MGLRTKFNIVMFLIFAIGGAVVAYVCYGLLENNARREVISQAQLMMDSANAIREYTTRQVRPELDKVVTDKFLPQVVPAFAATETLLALSRLNQQNVGYSYREAALNPTNMRDLAADWETPLVQQFRSPNGPSEIVGERGSGGDRVLYIAHPIRIKDSACLTCHSTPDRAPVSMLAGYGSKNGFGWNLNEVIGMQVVTVPMSIPLGLARTTFTTFMVSIASILAVLALALNLMLTRIVVRPVVRMAEVANQVSLGNFSHEEFRITSKDEVSVLAQSFNRLRRSLQASFKMLDT